MSELSPLLRGYELTDDSAELVADVEDLGDSYRVSIGGASRIVRDPARGCLERARVAAVFVALNLPESPPEREPGPATPPPIPTHERAEQKPSSAAPHARDARAVELRPFVSAEAAWGAGVASTGAGLGASLRLGSLTITLMGAATTSTTPYQQNGSPPRFQLQRWPLAALLGWETRLHLLGLGAEVGPALDVLAFDGKVVPNPDRALRLNPGLRFNAVLRVHATSHLAAELLPVISWFPRTYTVRVEPSQLLAETPVFWLGVALAINYQIWGG